MASADRSERYRKPAVGDLGSGPGWSMQVELGTEWYINVNILYLVRLYSWIERAIARTVPAAHCLFAIAIPGNGAL